MSNSSGNKKRKISINDKLLIIKELEKSNPPSKRSLAKRFDMNESSIRYIWSIREEIKKRCEFLPEQYKAKKKKFTPPKFPKLEDHLFDWIDILRKAKKPVSPTLALRKAMDIAGELSIPQKDFKASWGWFVRFKERRGLKSHHLCGEEGEINKEDPTLLSALQELYDTISTYDSENVYNMDECGLFFRMLPRYSLLMPHEDENTIRGNKKVKERLTLVVCTNASGTHKLPCTLIGKPKTPACAKGKAWPLKYISQKRAWMDNTAFTTWLNDVFYPEIRRKTQHPVLLLLDNAPGHMINDFAKENVTIKFFPPNITSWKQPLDLGVIAALKKRYKYLYLSEVLKFHQLSAETQEELKTQAARLRRGASGLQHGNPATLMDAANFVVKAWDSVSPASIRNCFNKADLKINIAANDHQNFDTCLDELVTGFAKLNLHLSNSDMMEYLTIDDTTSEAYHKSILEELNCIYEENKTENETNVASSSQNIDVEDSGTMITHSISFQGYKTLFSRGLFFEDQISCPEAKEVAGELYDELRDKFAAFQDILKTVTIKEQQ